MDHEEFKEQLIDFAQTVIKRALLTKSEEGTKQYLILPFVQLLGYDILDPEEVIPEEDASFSAKFKNKVDYAICKNKQPVIGIETKPAGQIHSDQRGELKGYYNAVPSIKLGVLTDGLTYELYSDTELENMMDDEPFAIIQMEDIAQGNIADNTLDAILKIRKVSFNPADIGADAKRKIFISTYVCQLEKAFSKPDEKIVRAFMDIAGIEDRKTPRALEEHTSLLTQAMNSFLDKKILERIGFADRDIVKVTTPLGSKEKSVESNSVVPEGQADIITTEAEMQVFNYVKNRLAFLVRDEELFNKLSDLSWVDYKTVFCVYYKKQKTGKLFSLKELANGMYRIEFPELDRTIETKELAELDAPLLDMYRRKVAELK